MSGSRVLVTGASGFVGHAVLDRLLSMNVFIPIGGVRDVSKANLACDLIQFDLSGELPLATLQGVDTLIHTAARVHVMAGSGANDLSAFRVTNVNGTLRLAESAALAGVKRFIFISSIKVNGESTRLGVPFTSFDSPAPVDPYGISKREAEDGLKMLSVRTGMEVVIIRPPLVYGPGVKANFLTMLRWVERRVPLPFGAIANKRSLVALDNLVDLIVRCIDHPAAPGHTFLVSDGDDMSTPQLLKRVADALDVQPALISLPPILLSTGLIVVGRHALAIRLCGSLQVDMRTTQDVLDWVPPISVEKAMRSVARYYLEAKTE